MMKKFYWMWAGQLVSVLASGITSFALGIWILKQTEQVSDFAIVIVIGTLPGILLTPFIGALIDRHNRKTIMILADLLAAVTTFCVAWLYHTDSLSIWHIYVISAIDSIALAFQLPAATAAVSLLVPKDRLGKAAGMNDMSAALAVIAGPFLAGMLINVIGLDGILVIDLLSFIFAAGILLGIKIPEPDKPPQEAQATSLLMEAKQGWQHLGQQPGLKSLLLYSALLSLIVGMQMVATMPMALKLATEAQVGLILSAAGVGALLGSMYMAISGGPKRKMNGLLAGTLVAAFSLFLLGIQPNLWLIGGGCLLFNLCLPVAYASEQVIWQHKIEPAYQGRVFAATGAITSIMYPVGSFATGLLADHLFEPLMMPDGALANSLGQVVGIGVGRGLALIFIVLGVLALLLAFWGYSNRDIRNIEDNLVDRV